MLPGVPVRTFADWAGDVRRAAFSEPADADDGRNAAAGDARQGPRRGMLKILADRQRTWPVCRAELNARCPAVRARTVCSVGRDHARRTTVLAVRCRRGAISGCRAAAHAPTDASAFARWSKEANLDPTTRNAVENDRPRIRAAHRATSMASGRRC
jgi:hypothetical protein